MADHAAITREVEAAYQHYIDVFNRRDAAEIADLFDRPHARVSGEDGLTIVSDDADQRLQWSESRTAFLADIGCDRTGINDLQIWPLSPTLAQLVADVTRYKKDGSVLQRFRANYTLRRRDGRWKVIIIYPVLEEAFPGPTLAHSSSS
jgi:hypothetical protein